MRKKKGIILLAVLSVICASLWPAVAQTTDKRRETYAFEFRNLGVKDGLSQSNIYAVCQDRTGFMWFGTQDGLNRYDGYEFKIYRDNPGDEHSLSETYILSLCEDPDGALWVGTRGGGLNRYDPRKDHFIRYRSNPGDPRALSDDNVRCLLVDRAGVLWVGTRRGLNRFHREDKMFTHYLPFPDAPSANGMNRIGALFEDRGGTLWVGTTGGGLHCFDRENNTFTPCGGPPGAPGGIGNPQVTAILEDTDGVLLVGSRGGLNVYDRESQRFTSYENIPGDPHSLSGNNVLTLFRDSTGLIWVGSDDGGLNIFHRERGQFIRFTADRLQTGVLSHHTVRAVGEDRSGILWFGTLGGGIDILDRKKKRFKVYRSKPGQPGSLSHPGVWSFLEDRGGALWVGTDNGLNRLDRAAHRFVRIKDDPARPRKTASAHISCIYEDRGGMLWVGTTSGIERFKPGSGDFRILYPDPGNPEDNINYISVILETRDGEIWAAGLGGLSRYDRRTETFDNYGADASDPHSLSHSMILALHEGRDGVLWIGTVGGGLNRRDPATGRFSHFRRRQGDPNSLSNDKVVAIHQDADGILWLGTIGGGLNRFDPALNTFTHYREFHGLSNRVVYGILEDENRQLWLSSNNGLYRFDPVAETFTNYGAFDGLQSNEFNSGSYYKSPRGEMFFGGIAGFNAFFPAEIKPNPYVPPVVLTAFKKFNQPVELDVPIRELDTLELSHTDTMISFEFSALSYSNPERNRYAYKLEGENKEWIQLGYKRDITLTNLSPGDYVFRVKGSNNDGTWNEKGASIRLIVQAPLWRTGWFQALAILSAALLVLLSFRLRIRKVEARRRELEKMVSERTAEMSRQKEKLEESERKYRDVVERANDAIIIVQDTRIRYANPQMTVITGFSHEELIGKPFYEVVPPDEREGLKDVYSRRVSGDEAPSRYEGALMHKDERKIDVAVSVGEITYRDQPAILVFLHDIRDRKALELEKIKSGKLESIGTMAGGVAHDFNNLLSVILGNVNLAVMYSEDKTRSLLARVEKAAIMAANLATQFITFTGGEEPVKLRTEIRDVIRDAVDFALGESKDRCRVNIANELPAIDCDREQIYQVVSNLVMNAAEAMAPDGAFDLEAGPRTVEEGDVDMAPLKPGDYVTVTVMDSGPGIPVEDQTKIFDPYFTTKQDVSQKGVGLGLSIVQSIVKKHGGYVNVISHPGSGSVFEVFLPAAGAQPPLTS